MKTEKRINVVTTEYQGDAEFPEAAHYPEYLVEQLESIYPGFKVEVSFGLSTKVSIYGRTVFGNMEHEVEGLVKVGLWDDFCASGYKEYSDNAE